MNQAPGEAAGDGLSPKVSLAFLFVGIILFTVALMAVSFPVGLYTVFGTRLSTTILRRRRSTRSRMTSTSRGSDTAKQQPGDVFAVFLLIYFGFLLLAGRQGRACSERCGPPPPAATRPSSRTRCPR